MPQHRSIFAIGVATAALVACTNGGDATAQSSPETAASAEDVSFAIEEMGQFEEPWAMTFWGEDMLVTELGGRMWRIDGTGRHEVTGLPEVDYGGQGGLGDVVIGPDGEWIYFSYAEAGPDDTRGAVVARGRLVMGGDGRTAMTDIETIWRQEPKVTGRGHYSHRIAFSPDGDYLYIASGDRQKMEPAQDIGNTLGTIVRLDPDGNLVPNPLVGGGEATAQIWSYGHRNILGLAFDPEGRLWEVEHGPAGGDELNLVERGVNYGWPVVSNGDHYDGTEIPDHDTRPELPAPAITWTPVIAPGGMAFYTGEMFAGWQGDLLIAGLKAEALVRVEFDGESAREAARYPMENRLREVEIGPDGAIWVLEDQERPGGPGGRLLRLTPGA